ncbi:MAG: hypothetical protein JNL10_17200 [Verrucomicrobiales bacterium]|nr:hypothetical protein [Verrucomicrobiales bacterium]
MMRGFGLRDLASLRGWWIRTGVFVATGPRLLGAVLFDASLGTAPDAQGWFVSAPSPMQSALAEGRFILDSRGGGYATRGGMFAQMPGTLRAVEGFTVRFDLQLIAESHGTPHRAGVSIIALDSDLRGLELAFWEDRIWAQADSPLFTHAEEEDVSPLGRTAVYELTFFVGRYALNSEGTTLLSGPMRDYSAFNGFPDVYEIPGFLYLGDDTTSAAGAFSVGRVEVTPLEPPMLSLGGRLGTDLEWSWPAEPNAWVPESAQTPEGPWDPVTESTEISGGRRRIRVSPASDARFFRLRSVEAAPIPPRTRS